MGREKGKHHTTTAKATASTGDSEQTSKELHELKTKLTKVIASKLIITNNYCILRSE